MNPTDLRIEVIRPVLQRAKLWSLDAEWLLLRTAVAESDLDALVQTDGPALGIFQVEPKTHNDIWKNWLSYRPIWAVRVMAHSCSVPQHRQLIWNLGYATLIARLVYYRKKQAIPRYNYPCRQAKYWKEHYNTPEGRGTVEHFMEANR